MGELKRRYEVIDNRKNVTSDEKNGTKRESAVKLMSRSRKDNGESVIDKNEFPV
jgi:hypothetical protein